ncbi:MAG: hypothetical protein MK066_01325 [Crocinitomicaceae bacterium]|nr:hypothetical protein [Crocinitomicaceae bacterium]
MKKGVLIIGMMFMTIAASFASGHPTLAEEIREKVIIDLSDVELNEAEEDFVITHFQIVDGEIELLGIEGTSEELEKIIEKKLNGMMINASCQGCETYMYRFTFEKQ